MDLLRSKKRIVKSISAILLAIVIATSTPFLSFSSQATSVGLQIDSLDFMSSFFSLLLSGKTISESLSNPFLKSKIGSSDIDDVALFFDKCNEYSDGLGDSLKSAVASGALNGSITMSAADRKTFLEYLQYCQANDIALPLTKIEEEYLLNPANYQTRIEVRWHTASDPTIQTDIITISSQYEYLFSLFEDPRYLTAPYNFIIVPRHDQYPSISKTSTLSWMSPVITSTSGGFNDANGNNRPFYNGNVRLSAQYGGSIDYIYDSVDVYTLYWPGFGRTFSVIDIADMLSSIVNDGIARFTSSEDATILNDNSEVVSSTSTVSQTGEIEGNFVIDVPDYDKLLQVIEGIKSGVLNLKDALLSLGLTTVDPNATVQEKEKTIQDLVDTVPASSITNSSTITVPASSTAEVNEVVDQMSVIQTVKQAISKAIADAKGEPFESDDNEEYDVGPLGNPYLEDWRFPDLSYSDPDPGGTDPDTTEDQNRAADIVNGLSFVTSFISSFYNVSKGFNMVYTVGISFVIFSIIIGASHFFGALNHSGSYLDRSKRYDWNRSDKWDSSKTDFSSKW